MKKSKLILAVLAGCMLWLLQCGAVLAADAKYSVDATEIEYDMASGEGVATGKTTIQYDGGTAVADGGATFNSKERTGRLYGGVTANKEDSHIRSRELVLYSPDYISAVGDAVLTKGGKTLQAPRVDYHSDRKFAETLGGSARLSSTDGSWLTAGKIVYDINTGRADATGGVNMENTGKRMTGSGDRAVYDSNAAGYIELIGNAKLSQDGNTVTEADSDETAPGGGTTAVSRPASTYKTYTMPDEDEEMTTTNNEAPFVTTTTTVISHNTESTQDTADSTEPSDTEPPVTDEPDSKPDTSPSDTEPPPDIPEE